VADLNIKVLDLRSGEIRLALKPKFKSGEFGRHSSDEMNFGVSLAKNSTIKRAFFTSSLRNVVQVVIVRFIIFSYFKCRDEFCQKLEKSVELCQSYA